MFLNPHQVTKKIYKFHHQNNIEQRGKGQKSCRRYWILTRGERQQDRRRVGEFLRWEMDGRIKNGDGVNVMTSNREKE